MTYLIDTSVCIAYLRGRAHDALRTRIESTPKSEIHPCSVVEAELWFGVTQCANPNRESEKVAQFDSLPFDRAAAEQYAVVRGHLESQGTPIGDRDLMIASIALTRGLAVVTLNINEFRRVPNLRVTDWREPA